MQAASNTRLRCLLADCQQTCATIKPAERQAQLRSNAMCSRTGTVLAASTGLLQADWHQSTAERYTQLLKVEKGQQQPHLWDSAGGKH